MANERSNDRELEILEMQGIMARESGRSFMYRILRESGVFADSFDADPYINAGLSMKRQTGLWLLNELKEASIDNYLKMIKENNNE